MTAMHHANKAIHRGLILALAFGLLLVTQGTWAAKIKKDFYNVDRFTDTGQLASPGNVIVRHEYGQLYIKDGFIPSGSSELRASIFNIDAATLSAVNGKFVAKLSDWVFDHSESQSINDYSAFQRSAETYSIRGVPYVIVSLSGAGGGGAGGGGASGKPSVSVSPTQPNAAEAAATKGQFLIALDAARGKNVTVKFLVSGKAKNGKDYVKIAKKVLIPAGNVSAFVDITPIDDTAKEDAETVRIKLIKTSAYKLSGAKSAEVTIADND